MWDGNRQRWCGRHINPLPAQYTPVYYNNHGVCGGAGGRGAWGSGMAVVMEV